MSRSITITTGARLHFGPLSYHPEVGRHFGGVGVMIEEPSCRLTGQPADQDRVSQSPTSGDRVREFVSRYRASRPADRQPPPCEITIERELPSHHGLGSGTQVGLAVARALALLAGEKDTPVTELARRVGRGRRSAVGIHGFANGGLIVDAGQAGPPEAEIEPAAADQIGALACRLAMPADWTVLLITPRTAETGLSGTGEERAFAQLGSMSQSLTDRLCRLVLTELLPSVQLAAFDAFSRTVSEYGRLVGEFFAPVQGGIFGHPRTDALIEHLRQQGVTGTGQTSWGPTVFAFLPDEPTTDRLMRTLPSTVDICRTKLRNSGATIEIR